MIECGRESILRGTGGLVLVSFAGLVVANCSSISDRPVDTIGHGDGGVIQPTFDAQTQDTTLPPVQDSAMAVDTSPPTDASACEAGLAVCGGQCKDLNTDPNNCGVCANACGTGVVCIGGQCACPLDGGMALCGNMCVDLNNDKSNCGACGHNCQGSMCQSMLCQATIVAQTNGPPTWGIAVDTTSMYWTQIAVVNNNGLVSSKPFAGSSTTLTISNPPGDPYLFDPRGISVDLLNMYWVDYETGTVEQTPLLGGPPVVLNPIPDGGSLAHPIDVTSDGQSVFWVTYDGGQVLSAPIGGGNLTVISSNESHPRAIAVFGANVFWVDEGTALAGTGSVLQAPKGGNGTVVTLAVGENQPWDVVVDNTGVYWTDRANPGQVKKTPIGGGTITTLADNEGAPYGIAIDADYVYWTDFNDNTINRLPKAGGAQPFVLATGQNNPSAIAVDARNVYWVSEGSETILEVAK